MRSRRPGTVLLAAWLLPAAMAASDGPPVFRDAAAETGLDFVHFNGMSGELYFPEMTGQGAALLDFDNDGDLDAYLVQGAVLGPGKTLADALFPPSGPLPPTDRLFRNDLAAAGGGTAPRFVDFTAASGIRAAGYGMGVAAGDYDGDGWTDLYVTNYGANQLWRNNGDGTFLDVTAASGTGDERWGTSASFFDYDGDGRLDLYVVNYVEFDLAANPACYATSSRRDYCGPSAFAPQPDRLFRNRGDGTFEDVTYRALEGYRPGPGLGVVAADFNGDRRLDLYVANDGAVNQLWINRGDGTFVDDALLAGAAVNREGRAEASMGVAAGDFDADGDEDLFMTHLMGETNTLYVNDGTAMFEDRTLESGLGAGSLPLTSFGTSWIDYDNDGWLDLLVLSGAVRILEPLAAAGDPYPLDQPKLLYRNRAGLRFDDATADGGPILSLPEVSRGAAFGDVDNDGDVDVLVANNNGPARLLLNERGAAAPWAGLRLVDRSGSYLLGSRARLRRGGGPDLWRTARTDGSYCSANDPRLTVGLGEPALESVRVEWPGGRAAELLRPPLRRYLSLAPAGARRGGAR